MSVLKYQNGRTVIAVTDTTKIFVRNNRYSNGTYSYTNSTYDDIVIPAGTVLGRIASSLNLTALASGANDGSQSPVGILAQDVTVLAGTTKTLTVSFCDSGDVNQNEIVLQGTDTLNTLITNASPSRTIRDSIGGDTVGVKLVVTTEGTQYDNY